MWLAVAVPGCGGGYGSPSGTPTPTPSPTPAGTIRFLGGTLPPGSTVTVGPMAGTGHQAQALSLRAGITMLASVPSATVQAYVRTDARRCMGGGISFQDLAAGVERVVTPGNMNNPTPPCALPYTTTQVEIEVLDASGRLVLTDRFPAVYNFVPE